jgi:hypothetical protein
MSARHTKGKANAKRIIIHVPLLLSDTEINHECAKLRMAQALARCEAIKCQAIIRTMLIEKNREGTSPSRARLLFKKQLTRFESVSRAGEENDER